MLLTKIAIKRLFVMTAFCLLLTLAPVAIANAACNPNAQSCSSTYQVTESFFGNGGAYSCSGGQFCANQSSGELTVGNTKGTDFQAQAGFNTDRTPYLEITVNTPDVDVGVLDASETHVGTATFQVKSYLAQGYQVTTSSPGPQNGGYTMAFPSSPTASAVGTEQFGMNVVANTCTGDVPSFGAEVGSCPDTGGSAGVLGADPAQDPDSTFSFGKAAHTSGTNYYDAADEYMYQDGSVIADSNSSSGFTNYTISYIFNISNVTPAGIYAMSQSLVATSTF